MSLSDDHTAMDLRDAHKAASAACNKMLNALIAMDPEFARSTESDLTSVAEDLERATRVVRERIAILRHIRTTRAEIESQNSGDLGN